MIHIWRRLTAFTRYGQMIYSVKPAYFYGLACDLHPVLFLRPGVPKQMWSEILYRAKEALRLFTEDEDNAQFLSRSVEKGKVLVMTLNYWIDNLDACRDSDLQGLHQRLSHYETILGEDIERTRNFVVTNPGNLSVDVLMDGASNKYPGYVLNLIDTFIRTEIDEAGKCLACARNTSCGFHILRSVEVAIKAYVISMKGDLPKNRNWGEYIETLQKYGASSGLIDELRVLKTKRNPLMHPQDILDEEQARQLFCLCEATLCAVIDDVRDKKKDEEFKAALIRLPGLN